jgi:uncharacterized membrane protein
MSRLLMLGVGAAIMYFSDPQAGKKRRNDFRNQLEATQRRVQRGKEVLVKDATNRTHGMLVQTRQWIEDKENRTPLSLETVKGTAQGMVQPWMQPHWSPTQRAAAGAFGAGLAAYGYLRGGLKGMLLCLLGGGLLARATTNQELTSLGDSRGILVEKTIHVEAPVDEVFAYWRNLENLPQWMSHVREVRYLGGDRYHWAVDGPAGMPVEWDSELLNVVDNQEMTWRSVEGSQVENTGRVRFSPESGGTRVHVHLRYMPPGGALGHIVAKAFGVDPKTEMNDDLTRMKSAIERGKPSRDATAQRRINGGNGLAAS